MPRHIAPHPKNKVSIGQFLIAKLKNEFGKIDKSLPKNRQAP